MERCSVVFGVNGYAAYAEFGGCSRDANGDLAPVGDQKTFAIVAFLIA